MLNTLVRLLTSKTTEKTNFHQGQYVQKFLQNVHWKGFLEVMHAVMVVLVSTRKFQVQEVVSGSRFCIIWKEYLSSESGRNRDCGTKPNPA